ncbi:hypothetical protein SSS_00901 [Sarcoptes scabiei]|uniref:Uncharacterized protein n=1 Tax=Sarcoptes scabiei TaxID=52283 RepID=A0A834V9T9_SARSC|nr:hypothetical protein SSS_00901 [Sarcoptes scabiei]
MAFMVPLVKNHYDIYNQPYALPKGTRIAGKNRPAQVNGTIVLNGIVLMNKNRSSSSSSSSSSKPTIIFSSSSKSKSTSKALRSQQKLPKSDSPTLKQQCLQMNKSPLIYSSSTQTVNTRSFPHVRRTVRNPINNRVYSYSVSIPEYVAEEDEDELEAEEEDEEDDNQNAEDDDNDNDDDQQCDDSIVDQMMIFSTSAPAGTGSIDNGIIDLLDEDDFVRRTGARPPPTITACSKQSLQRSKTKQSKKIECLDELNLNNNNTIDDEIDCDRKGMRSYARTKIDRASSKRTMSESADDDQGDHDRNGESGDEILNDCPTSNSREYLELLQKFVLHLKMLKLKKLFHHHHSDKNGSKKSKTNDNGNNSDNIDNSNNQNERRRSRSSTLGDSNNL